MGEEMKDEVNPVILVEALNRVFRVFVRKYHSVLHKAGQLCKHTPDYDFNENPISKATRKTKPTTSCKSVASAEDVERKDVKEISTRVEHADVVATTRNFEKLFMKKKVAMTYF
ncbi:unnamed protein product [Clavelina lepadiformis]|uniref:Uncharacterized protein n=1 Tax=Clavelina lepadiformis TaxID=159417 RepID=A0ABP0G8X3_CLALP